MKSTPQGDPLTYTVIVSAIMFTPHPQRLLVLAPSQCTAGLAIRTNAMNPRDDGELESYVITRTLCRQHRPQQRYPEE